MSMKVFTDALRRAREAADAFDRSTGYSKGFLVQEDRKRLRDAFDELASAMLAVRNADWAIAAKKAAVPDYKEIALVFGTALGTALSAGNGYSASAEARCTDAALREIFKIEVDKPAE